MPEYANRPFGVIVIAIIQLVKAGIAVWVLIQSDALRLEYVQSTGYVELTSLVIGLVGVGVAIGLWRLRRWAWVLIMLVLGVDMGLDLIAYYHDAPSYFQMGLNVLAVFYLNMRDVRSAFGRQPLGATGAIERA